MGAQTGPLEIEVKFPVQDRSAFEVRLHALGFRPGDTEDETNVLLDDAPGTLRTSGRTLRVRRSGGRGLVTYKGPARVAGGVRTRLELETGVDDPARLEEILRAIGFSPTFRYEKRRTPWAHPAAGAVVVVDETPLGLFAEVEGEEAEVLRVAAELGVPPADFIPDSYVALYLRARERDPSLPEHMTFTP